MNPQIRHAQRACEAAKGAMSAVKKRTFGQRLRALREASGLSLRKAAAHAKISPTYLSRLERDHLNPPADDALGRLARVYGASADDLALDAGRLPSAEREVIARWPRRATDALRIGLTAIDLASGSLSPSEHEAILDEISVIMRSRHCDQARIDELHERIWSSEIDFLTVSW